MTDQTDLRHQLLQTGFCPLPLRGKRPFLDDWQKRIEPSSADIDNWALHYPDARNTGALTRRMPTLDLDLTDPTAVEAVEMMVREKFEERGYILTRTGKAPKCAIPFRTNAPFKKISRSLIAPDGSTDQKIELLCDGQQVVVAGIHPDTQQPYRWHGGAPGAIAYSDLPYLHAEEAQALVDDAVALLVRYHGYSVRKQKTGNGFDRVHTDWAAGIREKAYARAALDGCAEELAGAAAGGRNELLNKLAFKLGRMVARGWINRATVEAELIDAMHGNGAVADDGLAAAEATLRSGLDAGEKEPHPDLADQADQTKEYEWTEVGDQNWEDTTQSSAKLVIKSSKEFVAGFIPPEYVVVGLLQRRFFYSFTGQTGAGKTAITLLLSACAALGRSFAGRDTKPIRVLYLAAENADDVRMRWIGLAQQMDFGINTIEVYFVEGRFSLSKSLQALRAEAERHGGEFGMVIVDTGPTFFEGKDENENKQLGDHARLLRSLIDTVPGAPCVVANCHPTKNAQADQLLPRGGGAFLAEADGNLTAAKTDNTVELHWQGKFRGPDFAPMYFLIRTVTHQDLKDSDGRLLPTVIAEHISEQTRDDMAAAAGCDEDAVLAFISTNPAASLTTIATAMGWKLYSGEANKMKAGRCIKELIKARLIKKTRSGRCKLTSEGEKELNKDDE